MNNILKSFTTPRSSQVFTFAWIIFKSITLNLSWSDSIRVGHLLFTVISQIKSGKSLWDLTTYRTSTTWCFLTVWTHLDSYGITIRGLGDQTITVGIDKWTGEIFLVNAGSRQKNTETVQNYDSPNKPTTPWKSPYSPIQSVEEFEWFKSVRG